MASDGQRVAALRRVCIGFMHTWTVHKPPHGAYAWVMHEAHTWVVHGAHS